MKVTLSNQVQDMAKAPDMAILSREGMGKGLLILQVILIQELVQVLQCLVIVDGIVQSHGKDLR